MGINLSVQFAFKPRRKVPQKQLDALTETACCADVGVRDDGYVYADMGDVGGDGSDAVNDFIRKHSLSWVVVTGDCDEGHFEEVVSPPHIAQWRAEVEWRQQRIRELTNEIVSIVAAECKRPTK